MIKNTVTILTAMIVCIVSKFVESISYFTYYRSVVLLCYYVITSISYYDVL